METLDLCFLELLISGFKHFEAAPLLMTEISTKLFFLTFCHQIHNFPPFPPHGPLPGQHHHVQIDFLLWQVRTDLGCFMGTMGKSR